MTENAYGPIPALTDHERVVWGVNNLVEMDRHDLAVELAETAPLERPEPKDGGTRAPHRVVLRRRGRRR